MAQLTHAEMQDCLCWCCACVRTPVWQRSLHSSAPMWRKSLYLKGGTTGAMWVKQHLTRSYDRGHLRPKGMRGQEHDAKRLMRLSTNRQEVSQRGRVW